MSYSLSLNKSMWSTVKSNRFLYKAPNTFHLQKIKIFLVKGRNINLTPVCYTQNILFVKCGLAVFTECQTRLFNLDIINKSHKNNYMYHK